MPQAQHRAEHHVHFAVRELVHLPGAEQEIDKPLVDLHRLAARVFVERAEIDKAAVLVINVKKLVVFLQNMRNFGRTLIKAFCRISCVVIYIGDRVEVGIIYLSLRLD